MRIVRSRHVSVALVGIRGHGEVDNVFVVIAAVLGVGEGVVFGAAAAMRGVTVSLSCTSCGGGGGSFGTSFFTFLFHFDTFFILTGSSRHELLQLVDKVIKSRFERGIHGRCHGIRCSYPWVSTCVSFVSVWFRLSEFLCVVVVGCWVGSTC